MGWFAWISRGLGRESAVAERRNRMGLTWLVTLVEALNEKALAIAECHLAEAAARVMGSRFAKGLAAAVFRSAFADAALKPKRLCDRCVKPGEIGTWMKSDLARSCLRVES